METVFFIGFVGTLAVFVSTMVFVIGNFPNVILQYKETLEFTASFIQTVAVIATGIWAYATFGHGPKLQNAIKIKLALELFEQQRVFSLAKYRADNDLMRFRLSVAGFYNQTVSSVSVAFLSKSLRRKIFDTLFLTITGKEEKEIEENFQKYNNNYQEIIKELDSIITY